MMFADVIIPLSVKGYFTYSIPQNLVDEVEIGKRVIVQFGKKKFYTAVIVNIHDSKPDYHTKEIVSVLDEQSILSPVHLKFWDWIVNYYMATPGDVLTAAIPVSMRLESQTQIVLIDDEYSEKLTDVEQKVINVLKQQKTLSISKIQGITGRKNPLSLVKKLIDKGLVDVYEYFEKKYKPKYEKFVKLSDRIITQDDLQKVFESLSRAKKQTDILLSYSQLANLKFTANRFVYKEVTKKSLLAKANASSSIINSLYAKDILTEYKKEITRLDFSANHKSLIHKLSDIQQNALVDIKCQFQNKDVVLLYGVTAAGKTEIYIHLIKEYLEQGKQVLYLLPEIALTTQIIERLKDAFGSVTGVYHSKFNDAERAEVWKRVHKTAGKKQFKLIVGVRSALFLPFSDLGLIIVDEEHENTYKQFEPAPRYHARDAAIVLARMTNAKVLLGTATPSVETYFNTEKKKYGIVTLTRRHKEVRLPKIIIADTLKARKNKEMKSLFHPLLISQIEKTLLKGEQIILFQNRRGFSPYVQCKTCGWIPKCTNCDVSLTYHLDTNDLVCHYCGYRQKVPAVCSECGDFAIETHGFGTQKIEDELKIFFPEVSVGRLDLDVAKRKYGYVNTLNDFSSGKTQILVGTQMITKGLNFENVRLVGVLDADNLLNYPDFRSYERTFHLLTQVSGRAGRFSGNGIVIIQTSQPEHPVLKQVLDNDFLSFYENEIRNRRLHLYPPFVKLLKITFKHKNQQIVDEFSKKFAYAASPVFIDRIQGPYAPLIAKIHNYYLREILIKIGEDVSLKKSKRILWEIAENLQRQKFFSNIQIIFNVDP